MKRSARRLNIIVAALLCAALLFALAGCDHSLEPQPDPEPEPITGGTTNKTDPDAPKEIEVIVEKYIYVISIKIFHLFF